MGYVGTAENRAWNECGGTACKRWEMQGCRMGSFEGREEGRQVCWRRAGQTSQQILGTVEEENSKDVVSKPHSVTVWLFMSSTRPFLRVAVCVRVWMDVCMLADVCCYRAKDSGFAQSLTPALHYRQRHSRIQSDCSSSAVSRYCSSYEVFGTS